MGWDGFCDAPGRRARASVCQNPLRACFEGPRPRSREQRRAGGVCNAHARARGMRACVRMLGRGAAAAYGGPLPRAAACSARAPHFVSFSQFRGRAPEARPRHRAPAGQNSTEGLRARARARRGLLARGPGYAPGRGAQGRGAVGTREEEGTPPQCANESGRQGGCRLPGRRRAPIRNARRGRPGEAAPSEPGVPGAGPPAGARSPDQESSGHRRLVCSAREKSHGPSAARRASAAC